MQMLWEIAKEFWALLGIVKDLTVEGVKRLPGAWRALLRVCYEELTGMAPEGTPTLLQVLVELKIVVSELPKKQRWAAYAGGIAAVACVCLLVVTAVTPGKQSTNSGSGTTFNIGNHTYTQPEFTKLDCLTCGGDGDCNTCRGYGEVERYAGAGETVRAKCPSCYGSGNCRTCGGSGKR